MRPTFALLSIILGLKAACLSREDLDAFGFTPINQTNPENPQICQRIYSEFGQCVSSSSVLSFFEELKREIIISQLTQLSNFVGLFESQIRTLGNLSRKIQKLNSETLVQPRTRLLQSAPQSIDVTSSESDSLKLLMKPKKLIFPENQKLIKTPKVEEIPSGSDQSLRQEPPEVPDSSQISFERQENEKSDEETNFNRPSEKYHLMSNDTLNDSADQSSENTTNQTTQISSENLTKSPESTPNLQPSPSSENLDDPFSLSLTSISDESKESEIDQQKISSAQSSIELSPNILINDLELIEGHLNIKGDSKKQDPNLPPLYDFSEIQKLDSNLPIFYKNENSVITVNNLTITPDLIIQMSQIRNITSHPKNFLSKMKNEKFRNRLYESELKLSAGMICLLTSGNATDFIEQKDDGSISNIKVHPSTANFLIEMTIPIISSICQLKRIQSSMTASLSIRRTSSSIMIKDINELCTQSQMISTCEKDFSRCPDSFKQNLFTRYFAPFTDKLTTSVNVETIYKATKAFNSRIEISDNSTDLQSTSLSYYDSDEASFDTNGSVSYLRSFVQTPLFEPKAIGYSVDSNGPDLIKIEDAFDIQVDSFEDKIAEIPRNLFCFAFRLKLGFWVGLVVLLGV